MFELLRDHTLLKLFHALEETSVFLYLTEHERASCEEIAEKCRLKLQYLKPVLQYVALHRPDVVKEISKDVYEAGTLLTDNTFKNMLYFSRAYEPVLHSLSTLLTAQDTYGKDIVRNHSDLALSSALYGSALTKDIVQLVALEKPEVVIDLGCGDGSLLRACAEETGVKGIGIDVDVARAQMFTKKGEHNIHFVAHDITKPLSSAIKNTTAQKHAVLTARMLMHEFLFEGPSELSAVFRNLQQHFSGAVLFIAEYDGFTPEELEKLHEPMKTSASVYQLVHPLTRQGVPQGRMAWVQTFKDCNVTLTGSFVSKPNSTIYKIKL